MLPMAYRRRQKDRMQREAAMLLCLLSPDAPVCAAPYEIFESFDVLTCAHNLLHEDYSGNVMTVYQQPCLVCSMMLILTITKRSLARLRRETNINCLTLPLCKKWPSTMLVSWTTTRCQQQHGHSTLLAFRLSAFGFRSTLAMALLRRKENETPNK